MANDRRLTQPPRVLLEDWLPAAAIGVECIRERSTGQQPPDKRLHVWWARRPLVASRAAVLGSLLPAHFPREVFERLLGFWGNSEAVVKAQQRLEWAKDNKEKIANPHGQRAFRNGFRLEDLQQAHEAMTKVWGNEVQVIDPMAGGGSIPFEAARLGIHTLANEYNPVACAILEATVDYPFRFRQKLARQASIWGDKLHRVFCERVQKFYPQTKEVPPLCYIFARTVPCPETGWETPLIPDWHLLKPKSGRRIAAVPKINKETGVWWIDVKELGNGKGQLKEAPKPTYSDGKGISLFTNPPLQIPADYIKAMAQHGKMGSALYAVVLKTPQGLRFARPTKADLEALEAAESELARLRPDWEKSNIIPIEPIPTGSKTGEPLSRGMNNWADLFSPRQLLAMGVLVEELQRLRPEIIEAEGEELGEAVGHILSLALDKLLDYNNMLSTWESTRGILKHLFQRHDYSFKATWGEMAPCHAGAGLAWAIENVLNAYENLAKLPRYPQARPVEIHQGSAANLPQITDGSITAVVVDPPYADNVQYSELADFFYVWLKRTQGHRRPEWFSTYLCDHDQEAVVNVSRHRTPGAGKKAAAAARAQAQVFYQEMMTRVFQECRRILRDDGVLTVMFTHKKQEAWASLFTSLIEAGFMITATWPVKTESEHSLHQANKNAAQSTVILVARKRPPDTGVGYFDGTMQEAIRREARTAAARLAKEGLNRVDQLVGAFGPAMEVFSRFAQVRTDTGLAVGVAQALEEAASAVSAWRLEELSPRGLEGVEGEGRFYLLCWDVLAAAEFRFNEAKLLGHAVSMDVEQLVVAGLVTKEGDKIKILPAKERRRDQALKPEEVMDTLFGPVTVLQKRTKKQVLKVHPNDPSFRTVLDACQALALRYLEAGGGAGGIGSARALMRQQGWAKDAPVAKFMAALVQSAPEAVRHERGKQSATAKFPEFRAWHSLLKPLFEVDPPDWTEKAPPELPLFKGMAGRGFSEEDLEDLETHEGSETEE
jgi:putative DNA methylase